MNIPQEAVSRGLEIANNAGLCGRKIQLFWFPPRAATDDSNGYWIVKEREE